MLLARGPSCGHDFDFHLVSWLEVARAWQSGALYPHWAQSANFGAGEPRFIFYPPASWMLGAALGGIFRWKAAPWLFTAICLFCAGLAMRRFAEEWLRPVAATAAACLYIANPYMLFVGYERTAYGELMAAALIPLLLSFAVRPLPPIAALSATIAGIWLMNAPSGVMACYALLWIALLRLVSERSWRAPLRMAAATAIGLTLAGFYLVPAAHQERWVEIARAIGPDMRFQDSFLFHHTGEPFHDTVLHTASMLACILLAVAFASILFWRDALRSAATALACFVCPADSAAARATQFAAMALHAAARVRTVSLAMAAYTGADRCVASLRQCHATHAHGMARHDGRGRLRRHRSSPARATSISTAMTKTTSPLRSRSCTRAADRKAPTSTLPATMTMPRSIRTCRKSVSWQLPMRKSRTQVSSRILNGRRIPRPSVAPASKCNDGAPKVMTW